MASNSKTFNERPPCNRCSTEKHLKCDTDDEICRRCKTNQQPCVRGEPRIKFGRNSGPNRFAQDQQWVSTTSETSALKFIDETGDTIASYRGNTDGNDPNDSQIHPNVQEDATAFEFSNPSPRRSISTVDAASPFLTGPPTSRAIPEASPTGTTLGERRDGYDISNHTFSLATPGAISVTSHPSATSGYTHPSPQQRRFNPSSDQLLLSNNHKKDNFLHAILIRYYTENLAHWFDLNDPLRHFTMVVPLRSRQSRPLLNAILTASARQLIRARIHRNSAGAIEWRGNVLSDLNEEVAMHFQNECIRELLDLSLDTTHVMSADLLAAAVILRTDEEMDSLFREDGADGQIFLSVAHAYIDAQVTELVAPAEDIAYEASPDTGSLLNGVRRQPERVTTPEISNLPIADDSYRLQSRDDTAGTVSSEADTSRSLRQACFWAACRQDVHGSLLKQRPINFPLPYCNAQRSLAPAQDHIWTIRAIVFCADVLEYSYGRRSGRVEVAPAYANLQRWQTLKQRHADIVASLPDSFEPTYSREPKREDGEALPQIWFQDPCYATGIGHLELVRILLTVFDPFTPRLGLGSLSSRREKNSTLKSIVLKLCGIAISNRNSPPNFINAFTAITLCGEYFTDVREQTALLSLLDSMQFEFAYYTERVADKLKDIWHQQSTNIDDMQY